MAEESPGKTRQPESSLPCPWEDVVFSSYSTARAEKRIPMAVAVRIAGHSAMPGEETTFTEDVSSRGAKLYSARRWKPDERLLITTLTGGFRSLARVAWCMPTRDAGFAVGIQLVETSGKWIVPPSGPTTNSVSS